MNTTQKHRTTVTSSRAGTRWYAATLCAACLSVACVGLLASCAAAPEGATVAQAEQPSEAEPQVTRLPATPASEAERWAVRRSGRFSGDDQAGQKEPAARKSSTAARTTAATVGQQRGAIWPPQASAAARLATTQPASRQGAGCGSKSKRAVPTPSPDGPQPRWVCTPKITADPVWYGKPVEFVFEISNEGEGDLQVQLKGG